MKIQPHTANVLALCFYGVNPAEGVSGRKWTGRKAAISSCVASGMIAADRRTLTEVGLAILQEHVR